MANPCTPSWMSSAAARPGQPAPDASSSVPRGLPRTRRRRRSPGAGRPVPARTRSCRTRPSRAAAPRPARCLRQGGAGSGHGLRPGRRTFRLGREALHPHQSRVKDRRPARHGQHQPGGAAPPISTGVASDSAGRAGDGCGPAARATARASAAPSGWPPLPGWWSRLPSSRSYRSARERDREVIGHRVPHRHHRAAQPAANARATPALLAPRLRPRHRPAPCAPAPGLLGQAHPAQRLRDGGRSGLTRRNDRQPHAAPQRRHMPHQVAACPPDRETLGRLQQDSPRPP